ncbi:MAG: cytochrome P450 [Linnemannia gamsii]|nr:MAG: cytochrome P450 [Linnemannia gamsii]
MSTVASSTPAVAATAIGLTKTVITFLAQKQNSRKLLLAYALYLIYKYRRSVLFVRPRPDLPGPPGLPLIGNFWEMATVPKTDFHQAQERNFAKYGKVYTMAIPGIGRTITVKDPEILDHILRTHFWIYEKGTRFKETLGPLVGDGIFTADGDHWKWQRQHASKIFTVKAFRQYTNDVFIQEAERAINYLEKFADTGKAVDLQRLFYCFTLDSFGEIAFGEVFGCLDDPDNDVDFAAAFDRLNHGLAGRFLSPVWKLVDWWTGNDKRVASDRAIVRDFAQKIIDRRRRERREGKDAGSESGKKDLLQLFMDIGSEEGGTPLSDEMLVDSVLNFVIAGRDTTAQALAWTFYLMHRREADPAIVERLVQETDEVLKGGLPTYESTKQQKFAEACFNEALRLYPAVPRNAKICTQDDVLPGGIQVHKGERVTWNVWAMGRDEELWGKDARIYNPFRWIGKDKPSSSKFASFHHGPRICLGQGFAITEAVTLMSMVFQKFTFELENPDQKANYMPSLTLPMDNGLRVYVKRRTD